MSPACSILSLQRELLVESESDHQSGGPNSLPLSQERLIRKAAGLSHFLINEVAVAPVSSTFCPSYVNCHNEQCSSEKFWGKTSPKCWLLLRKTLFSFMFPCLSTPQPCQTIYQVFHDAVTRLIQYGVLYVAEVSLHSQTSMLRDENGGNHCD